MNLKTLIPLCLVGVVGYATPVRSAENAVDTGKDISLQFNDIVKKRKPLSSLPISDRNFTFAVDANGIPSFEKKNPDMTFDELSSFVKVRCLNEKLYPKMAKGEPISQDDALLLSFAMDVQLTMIKVIGVAMAWDIHGKEEKFKMPVQVNSDVPELAKREYDMFRSLMEEFVNGNGGLRNKIRAYGKNFLGMDSATKGALFDEISQKGKLFKDVKKTPDSEAVKKTHPWLYGMGLYKVAQKNMEHISKSEYEEAASGVFGESNIGQEWLDVWELSEVYLREYWETYGKVKSYYTSTKLTGDDGLMAREYAKRIFQRALPMTNMILSDYCVQFCDFPFVLLTMKARGEYRNCKGFWNDDEEAMKAVMMKYGETICGTDMMRHLNSTYSIDAYADFLEKFKSDIDFMFDGNFKRFQAVTRIREFARDKTSKDLNTGLDLNGFKEIE